MAIRQFTTRRRQILVCVAVAFVLCPILQARPREMADAEMDQVCAKGSTGPSLNPVAINQLVFQFTQATSLGQVSGSGSVLVQVSPNASGNSSSTVTPLLPIPGNPD